jgi:hypothetical protein
MKLLLALMIAAVLIVTVFFFRSFHLSNRVSSAVVTYDGKTSIRSMIYQCKDGTLLLLLREAKEPPWEPVYILSVADKWVYLPNRSNYSMLPGWMYTWHLDQGGTPLGGAKSEVEPNVIVGDRSFEFTAEFTSARVGLQW